MNAAGELLGRITLDDVVDFIREEAERDYQLASGLTDEVESDDSVYEVTRARIPWLLIGLFGGLIVALIIGKNEEDIKLVPALAFFMPLIAAMAGNVPADTGGRDADAKAQRRVVSAEMAPACFSSTLSGHGYSEDAAIWFD